MKIWSYIQHLFGWSIGENYRIMTTFMMIVVIYVFRDGFWGMDFLAWVYTFLLLFPFFSLILNLRFPKFFIMILIATQCAWIFWTKSFPIGWVLVTMILYTFLYNVNLYFYDLKASMTKIQHILAWLKITFLIQAFIYVYEPMRLTWYIEGMVLIRLYAFLGAFLLVYAGLVFGINDWRRFRLLLKQKRLQEKNSPVDKQAI